MDPRERADAILARARARGAYVVTPDSATSPMDAVATLQIPRTVVTALDQADPDVTTVLPATLPGMRPTVELPAIAQEAVTQSFASPPRPPERVEGLLPTVKQPPPQGPSHLTQRLDGGH